MSIRTKLVQTDEGYGPRRLYDLYRVIGPGKGKLGKNRSMRDWFLIKQTTGSSSRINVTIYFPKDLMGKKARIKVEVE